MLPARRQPLMTAGGELGLDPSPPSLGMGAPWGHGTQCLGFDEDDVWAGGEVAAPDRRLGMVH